ITLLQPLIAPLYDGRTAAELLAAFTAPSGKSSHDLVREHWQHERGGDFDAFWEQALHDGVVPDTAVPARPPQLPGHCAARLRAVWDGGPTAPPGEADGLELVLRPDPYVLDGQFANNGWLQELPRPLTKLTWDNAALLAPATAERLGLTSEDVVELSIGSRSV